MYLLCHPRTDWVVLVLFALVGQMAHHNHRGISAVYEPLNEVVFHVSALSFEFPVGQATVESQRVERTTSHCSSLAQRVRYELTKPKDRHARQA